MDRFLDEIASKIGDILLSLHCSCFRVLQSIFKISLSGFKFKYVSDISGCFAVTVRQLFSTFEIKSTNFSVLSKSLSSV